MSLKIPFVSFLGCLSVCSVCYQGKASRVVCEVLPLLNCLRWDRGLPRTTRHESRSWEKRRKNQPWKREGLSRCTHFFLCFFSRAAVLYPHFSPFSNGSGGQLFSIHSFEPRCFCSLSSFLAVSNFSAPFFKGQASLLQSSGGLHVVSTEQCNSSRPNVPLLSLSSSLSLCSASCWRDLWRVSAKFTRSAVRSTKTLWE